MSLVQHVTAVEGQDFETEDDIASLQLGRRLSHQISYDVFPLLPEVIEKLEPVGAYKVSTIRRTAQVAVGVLTCALACGVIFGFSALKSVLIEEGVYRELCTEEELSAEVELCYDQDQKLNLVFIIGSVTTNISALLVGTLLDRFGPRFCGIVSGVLLVPGSLCLAFESALPFDAFMLGFFLLALGGTFSFVPSFHLSNAFPQLQGLILSLITGAFDASAAVFLIFRVLYQSSHGTFGLRKFFLVYLIVPVLILITQALVMPTRSYETRAQLVTEMEATVDPLQDMHDSDDELETQADIWKVRRERAAGREQDAADIASILGNPQQQAEFEEKEDDKRIASGIWGALHGIPALQQIQTPWFILITFFTILQMIRFNFFISTIYTQYRYMLDSSRAATEVTEFFDLALPVGGIVTVPFIGLLLDGTSTVTVLGLLVTLSTFIGMLGAVPTASAAYANVCIFVIFRPLYYSAMSDYAAKVFGFATFGRVYGLIITLSGLLSFTQSGLQAAVHNTYQRDPGPINLTLAGSGLLIGLALIMYVDVQGRQVQKKNFPGDDDERRSLLLSRRGSRSSIHSAYASYGTTTMGGSLRHKNSRSGMTLEPVSEAAGEESRDASVHEETA